MKILVVTSEVTFVPKNYNAFLEGLFNELSSDKDLNLQLVVLKNNSLLITIKALLLALIGARYTGWHLLKNTFVARRKDRMVLAKKHNIKLHFFKNPNYPDFQNFMRREQIDVLVNARTRFIYKNKTLRLAKIAALNIHHGLLPEYRGVMCDLWALDEERPTGFTIHVMEKKIDDGAIVRRVQTSTNGDLIRKNFTDLILESSRKEGLEMADVIKNIKKNHAVSIEKDNISSKIVYSKNPNFMTIRKMLQKGIQL